MLTVRGPKYKFHKIYTVRYIFISLFNHDQKRFLKKMSKAEQTRQFIIEKTAVLFNKNGFAGTSLSDMTTATGLTKGSIYGNFENKEEVMIAVFKHSSAELAKNADRAVSIETSAYNKLIAYTKFYRNNWVAISETGGCPMLNAAIETDDALPFMTSAVQDAFASWTKRLEHIIELGIEQHEFRPDINSKEYATTFLMLIEGGILLSKVTNAPQNLYWALDRIVKIINDEIVK